MTRNRLLIAALALVVATPALARGPAQTAGVREASRQVVAACEARLPVGATRTARYESTQLCKKPSNHLQTLVNFRLSRQEDGLHAAFKLRFGMDPKVSTARAHDMLESARQCVPQLRKVWGRYGLKFDLAMDSDREPTVGGAQQTMRLSDDYGRPNSSRVFFNGVPAPRGFYARCLLYCSDSDWACASSCEPNRQNELCLTLLHETGHMVGLFDEHPIQDCPDLEEVSKEEEPWSVMNDEFLGWDSVEFFPRHLETVVAPLCPRQ